MREYQYIVEHSYTSKSDCLVVRFLDGTLYKLKIEDLPKRMQTKKPDWENSVLSEDRTFILVKAGGDTREIPAHLVHAKGKEV